MTEQTASSRPNAEDPQCRFLTEAETAVYLNMSRKWLQKERARGGGIPFLKFGAAVRYRFSDIEDYERKSLHISTSDGGAD